MPSSPDHALAVLTAIVYPTYATVVWFCRSQAQLEAGRPGIRIRIYRETMIELWILTALVLTWWIWAGRSAAAIGLGTPTGPWFWIGAGIAAGVALFLGYQVRAVASSPEVQDKVRAAVQGSAALMVPSSTGERHHWVALSLTAGICEEVLYRAFLMGYLATWLPDAATVAITAIIFGLAHVYLGLKGVIQATIAGAIFGGAYLLTGSIWISIVLHATVDIASGLTLGAALASPRTPAPTHG